MTNIVARVEGTKLILEVDLSQEHGRSKTGKSVTIASTGGNVSVPGHEEVKMGINIYKPAQ